MFGAQITNSKGSSFIYGAEEGYHLWGVVAVTRRDGDTSDPRSAIEYPLFNMPESWSPIVFIRARSDSSSSKSQRGPTLHKWGNVALSYVDPATKKLRLYTQFYRMNGSITWEAYVFVPASRIPVNSGDYGVLIYNASNKVVFNSNRPILTPDQYFLRTGVGATVGSHSAGTVSAAGMDFYGSNDFSHYHIINSARGYIMNAKAWLGSFGAGEVSNFEVPMISIDVRRYTGYGNLPSLR